MAEGTYDWEGTNDGVCISMHALGGCGGMLPQKNVKMFKIRCCEIASDAIFVLKFIFGLDAAGILGPSAFGVPLAMFRDRMHVFQQQGMVKKVTAPDSLKGGH